MLPEPPAKGSLELFVREAWPQLVPAPLEWGSILVRLCGSVENTIHHGPGGLALAIEAGPRCGKTMLMSVLLPAWIWTWAPTARILTAARHEPFALAHARRSRELLHSEWYCRRWGEASRPFLGGSLAFTENRAGGYRLAVAACSALSGLQVDVAIADCLRPPSPADSARCEQVSAWWHEDAMRKLVPDGLMLRIEEERVFANA